MNYKIINDDVMFQDFTTWLPELKNGEAYYVTLFARKKYCTDTTVKLDKAQLKRFTTDKEFMYRKVKQLECALGSYTMDGVTIPQEALALYISINPRSFEKASKNSLIRLANLVTKEYDGYNPHQEVLSEIQSACGTKHYFDFDYDGITVNELANLIDYSKINKSCLIFMETRGGVHLLVAMDKIDVNCKKTWHQHLASLPNCDVKGDNLTPVVGCTQGGFTPNLTVF